MKAIFLVLFFATIAGLGLLRGGLPPSHDGEYHVIRFYQFDKTLRDGDFYPRWQPDLNKGYGSPLLNFYYPLPNYLASLLHSLGLSFIDSLKIQMFIAVLLGALFMYLWGYIFFGSLGGIVASIFYTYSPYHFLDIYIRGASGEVLALAFFPAFLWSVTKLIKEKRLLFVPISAVFLALIIFSHNILAFMFFPFGISYMLFLVYQEKDKSRLLYCFIILILALGLSSIFWLPALVERNFVQGLEIFDYRQHFAEIYQLIFPSWGSGFSADPKTEGLSFQIGIANLVALILAMSIGILQRKKLSTLLKLNIFIIVWTFVVIFIVLRISEPLWDRISLMRYIQFPWRLLSLAILSCSFLAGSIAYFWKAKFVALALISLSVILGIGYSRPAYYHLRDDAYYLSRPNFIDGTNVPGNSFNTIWLNQALPRKKTKIELLSGKGKVEVVTIRATNYKFKIFASEKVEVLVNTAYFPGWTAFVGEKEIKLKPSYGGLISFSVPKGNHIVNVRFQNTIVRAIGTWSFYISLFLILILFIQAIFATIRK